MNAAESDVAAPSGCLSDLRLDRWVAGELDPGERVEVEGHVEGCARCTARRAERDQEQRLFQQTAPPLDRRRAGSSSSTSSSSKRAQAPRWRRLGGAAVLASALAAAVVMILPVVRPRPRPSDEGIIAKGRQWLRFYVRDGVAGTVRQGGPREPVSPGDQLRFVFEPSVLAGRRVAVLARDAAGAVSLYFPDGGGVAVAPPSQDGAIPYSIKLDETLGPETLYALACTGEVSLAPLRAALAQVEARVPAWPSGCTVETVVLEKKPRR